MLYIILVKLEMLWLSKKVGMTYNLEWREYMPSEIHNYAIVLYYLFLLLYGLNERKKMPQIHSNTISNKQYQYSMPFQYCTSAYWLAWTGIGWYGRYITRYLCVIFSSQVSCGARESPAEQRRQAQQARKVAMAPIWGNPRRTISWC